MNKNIVWVLLLAVLVFSAEPAWAQGLDSGGVLNDAIRRFKDAAGGWASVIQNAATWLFWTLAVISMVWTFGIMALRKADLAEFFAEFVKFTIFTGFFWWLLSNATSGMNIAGTIVESLVQLAAKAGNLSVDATSPSGILDKAFIVSAKVDQAISKLEWYDIAPALSMSLMALGIVIMFAIVALNLVMLQASSWFLLYAGIFFLGFGGSRWTSEIAITYYRTVLGIAAQWMAMLLIVAIGSSFADHYIQQLKDVTINDCLVMVVVAVILLFLTNKIPPLLMGIISGGALGAAGGIGGSLGVGTLAAAGGMAVGALATGGAALAAGAAAAAGGASAVMAAAGKASENVSSGSDIMSRLLGGIGGDGAGSSGGGGGGGSGGGSTPMASAAGDNSSGGGSGGSSGGSSGGFAATAAKGGRIAADTVANLAKGAGSVAMTKAGGMKAAAQERIADTVGGKIASAIRGAGATASAFADGGGDNQAQQQTAPASQSPSFDDNSLGATSDKADAVDADSEVASFANKHAQP